MKRLLAILILCGLFAFASDDQNDRRTPADNLIAASFNRGDASDRSSYNRTPTVGSGATSATRCWDFDATSNAYVTWPDANELETFPLTVCAWFRNDAATNANGISLITKSTIAASPSTAYRGWYISYSTGTTGSNGLKVSIVEDTFSLYRTWSNRVSYDDATWRHMAFTAATVGSTPILYVNGVAQTLFLTGAGAATTVATTGPVMLGGRGYNEQNTYFNGALDDVRIMNRVLSADEIATIYSEGLGVTRP